MGTGILKLKSDHRCKISDSEPKFRLAQPIEMDPSLDPVKQNTSSSKKGAGRLEA